MAEIFEQEKKKINFNPKELQRFFYFNSEQVVKDVSQGLQDFSANPKLTIQPNFHSMSRIDQIKLSGETLKEINQYKDQKYNYNTQLSKMIGEFQFPFVIPSGVHQMMFIPTIKYLGTEEQQKKWLPRIYSYEIVGCYCQTELGHGSDVQSLETTAEYDVSTQEFIINSPSLTSTKWWVGELGVWANHALVFAQLHIKGKKHGVHPILVQIRDLKTHQPLPGIVVGDIGPKVGYNVKDNGFIRFNNIRVPRENMLMKYSKVSKDGLFTQRGNPKIAYAGMLETRLGISCLFHRSLGRALAIGVRYSLFRKQFKTSDGVERQVLDYQTQQEKLFIPLADSYAFCASSSQIMSRFAEFQKEIEAGDFSNLNEMHIICSGAKAYHTEYPLAHMENIRLSCGGHGFSHYSGLPSIVEGFKPLVTLEGENTIMYLQVARFLIKGLTATLKGAERVPNSIQYLKAGLSFVETNLEANSISEILDLDVLKKILVVNATYLIKNVGMKMQKLSLEGKTNQQIWDTLIGIQLVDAAKAHMLYYTFINFYTQIVANDYLSENSKTILKQLCRLFAIAKINEKPHGLIESGFINPSQISLLKQAQHSLYPSIREQALGLVDAFGFKDEQLRSALSISDGKVYETLLDWAKNQNPLNESYFAPGYENIQKMGQLTPKPLL
ncbi:hypothetical protein ABPG74_012756 [Tetrahymena malaccensis]